MAKLFEWTNIMIEKLSYIPMNAIPKTLEMW